LSGIVSSRDGEGVVGIAVGCAIITALSVGVTLRGVASSYLATVERRSFDRFVDLIAPESGLATGLYF